MHEKQTGERGDTRVHPQTGMEAPSWQEATWQVALKGCMFAEKGPAAQHS